MSLVGGSILCEGVRVRVACCGRARAHGGLDEREQVVTVELGRRPAELRREILHEALHEVPLPQQQELLQVVAVLAQLEALHEELEQPSAGQG